MNDTTNSEEQAIDRLLDILFNEGKQKIKTLVTHKYPDDDAWLCLWIATNFIPNIAEANIVFINSGNTINGIKEDPSILHFDTGGGQDDQHGKGLKRTCSAKLLAERLNIAQNPGLKPLLELAVASDNIDRLPVRDIHFLIKGYPQKFRTNGETDWDKVRERVFENFDVIYGQEEQREESRRKLKGVGRSTILPNGIKVTSILWNPVCREAAFEEDAAVVIWTAHKRKRFYTGIQVNRNYPIFLDNVVAALRFQENKVRLIKTDGDLHSVGKRDMDDPWFLYDNKKLVLNGSRAFELTEEQFTKLDPDKIIGTVHSSLSAIPKEIVSRWRK
ncbi:MAG: hypothetical protein ABIA08_01530 [bacterium]